MNRRHFIQSATAAAVAPAFARGVQAAPVKHPLRQLDYPQVQLLPGRMLTQFDHNHQLFLHLDDDRLLKPFRQLTGMSAPGEDMGGWYSPSPNFDPPRNMTGYIPGHSFGQYLSSLARAYAVTGDKATQQKVHTLVAAFAATVSPKFYERYCLPCYTFDKTVIGLIDAHQFTQSPLALDVLSHATDAVLPFLPDHALTRAEMRATLRNRPGYNEAFNWDEPYTLPENLYLAYTRGAGARYRSLAQRYLQDAAYFTPLAENRNVLPGEHAYSHLNALNSSLQAYLVDGFHFVQQQSYATGGWGPNESFQKPATNDLADTLDHTHHSFETPCGAYGHFKIARGLLCVTGDTLYGDSMETVLYNTILGASPIQPEGTSFYYSDFGNHATKTMCEQKWPCCSGTFPQLTADYGISSYFATARGLAVNLYHPSRVAWRQGAANVTLSQATSYPLSSEITLSLTTDRNIRFPLQLRIPAWAGPATRVSIDGKPSATPHPGAWHTIDREWHNGDRVEISLDMPLRLLPLDATHPDLVALVAGPLALFTVLPAPAHLTKAQLLSATRTGPAEWSIATQDGVVKELPYTAIDTQTYRLYHQTESNLTSRLPNDSEPAT
jgi:DUF1680 family protein